MKILSSLIIGSALFTNAANANAPSDVIMDENAGCLSGPIEQFGRYLGNWDIRDQQLNQDGTWTEQPGAKWNFMCVGNGIAVQDFWMPNNGGMGTNLRIHDAETGKWDIAWTSTGAPGFSHITAEELENGNILMHYVNPIETPRRITFFPPTKDAWNWHQEMSFDGGATWTIVYKIEATRAK